VFRRSHQEGRLNLWGEQTIGVRHPQLGLKVGTGTEAADDEGRTGIGSDPNGEIGCGEDLHPRTRSAKLRLNDALQERGALIQREERLFIGVRQDCNDETIGDRKAATDQIDVTKRHRIETARVERHSFTHCQPPITLC
jgi:hypothetical protein